MIAGPGTPPGPFETHVPREETHPPPPADVLCNPSHTGKRIAVGARHRGRACESQSR